MPIKKRPIKMGGSIRKRKGAGKPAPKSFKLAGTEVGEILLDANTTYGLGTAQMGRDIKPIKRIRTGIFALDVALGGGWMPSRAVMAYGEKSTGKTSIAMRTAVRMQRLFPDQIVVYIDVEHTFDMIYFVKLGGDKDRILIVEPTSGELAVDMADAMIRAAEVSLVVVDSIAMMVPMAEIDASADANQVGIQARLINRYVRKMTQAIMAERHRGHRPLVFNINQFRMKIGVSFGDPRTLPGGKGLEFSTSQQLETRIKKDMDKNKMVMRNEHTVVVTKNKTGGRYTEAKFKTVVTPHKGMPEGFIDQTRTIVDWAKRYDLCEGQYYIPLLDKKFRTYDEITAEFVTDPEACDAYQGEIIHAIMDDWGLLQ